MAHCPAPCPWASSQGGPPSAPSKGHRPWGIPFTQTRHAPLPGVKASISLLPCGTPPCGARDFTPHKAFLCTKKDAVQHPFHLFRSAHAAFSACTPSLRGVALSSCLPRVPSSSPSKGHRPFEIPLTQTRYAPLPSEFSLSLLGGMVCAPAYTAWHNRFQHAFHAATSCVWSM